jgi:hypothetical protein
MPACSPSPLIGSCGSPVLSGTRKAVALVSWWHGSHIKGVWASWSSCRLHGVVAKQLRAKARPTSVGRWWWHLWASLFSLKAPLWSLLRPFRPQSKLFGWKLRPIGSGDEFPPLGHRFNYLAPVRSSRWVGHMQHRGWWMAMRGFHVVACAVMTMLMSDGLVAAMTLVVGLFRRVWWAFELVFPCSEVGAAVAVGTCGDDALWRAVWLWWSSSTWDLHISSLELIVRIGASSLLF